MPAELNFNAEDVAPQTGFEPLPAGKYRAHITESEVKPTKKGDGGKYLQLTWEILDEGPYKGRKVFDRLNIQNSNATAQEIAQRQLSAICHCTGQMKLKSSAQLHHIPVVLTLKVKQDVGYEPRNEIGKYEAAEGVKSIPYPKAGGTTFGQGAAAQVTVAAPVAQPTAAPPAWAQKKAG